MSPGPSPMHDKHSTTCFVMFCYDTLCWICVVLIRYSTKILENFPGHLMQNESIEIFGRANFNYLCFKFKNLNHVDYCFVSYSCTKGIDIANPKKLVLDFCFICILVVGLVGWWGHGWRWTKQYKTKNLQPTQNMF